MPASDRLFSVRSFTMKKLSKKGRAVLVSWWLGSGGREIQHEIKKSQNGRKEEKGPRWKTSTHPLGKTSICLRGSRVLWPRTRPPPQLRGRGGLRRCLSPTWAAVTCHQSCPCFGGCARACSRSRNHLWTRLTVGPAISTPGSLGGGRATSAGDGTRRWGRRRRGWGG